ncbi:MAG: MFS transporter [Chloroflexota bacterium]
MTFEAEPILPVGPTRHWHAALRRRGFPAYLVAAGGSAAGWNMGAVIFAWVALVVTTDPLSVGLVFAVRFLMLLVLGIPAGVLADRVDRRRLFQASALGGAAVAGGLALLAMSSGGALPLWALVVGSMLLGALDSTRIAASQAFAFDLVGVALATTGLALGNVSALVGSVLGSLVAGTVLDQLGLAPAFLVMAVVQVGVAIALAGARPQEARAPRPRTSKASGLRESLTLLQRDRLLRLLAFVVIVVEVLGFSCATLIPVFTRDVFGAGPDAYGTMNAIRALGGVLALILVVRFGARAGTGLALLGASLLFGVGLVGFALSPGFAAAIVPMLLVGAAGAATDSLSQALIQHAVTDAERGAAVGVWAFGLGFGPLGYVAAGAWRGATARWRPRWRSGWRWLASPWPS